MTTTLQIGQSLKVVRAALITHLDSFKKSSSAAFGYYYWEDLVGIHHFDLSFKEDGYMGGSSERNNLGSVRLRPLGSKLLEMVIEDSVWFAGEPRIGITELEDKLSHKARKARSKEFLNRLRSIHQEVRDYILEQLEEDRLLDPGAKLDEKASDKQKAAVNTPTQVFISYAHEDIQSALKIYEQLKAIDGIYPWLDKESLQPGMRWRPAIKKAIRESDFFLALLSKRSTSKKGYVQTEMKEALEIWDQFPEDKAFLIPIRLESCEPSYEKLREVQCEDFFPNWDRGFQRVLQVIDSTARASDTTYQASTSGGYEYRCAIVDFDNGLTNLAQICQRLNSIQRFFHFSFPSFPYDHSALREFDGQPQLYVPAMPKSFYKKKGLLNADLVAGLTKYLLAFDEDGETYINYLSLPSDVDDTFLFMSTHGLYEFAKAASCTFEKGIVYHILTQLLIHFASGLGFHTEVRGCILDFCEEHSWIIKGMKRMKLCPSCAKGIENADLKEAALAILAEPFRI